jgi:Na+-driven multidrug efflux pump
MAGLENETLFETMKPGKALAKMALPTIGSQLIILIYNLADTWFIGRTNNPYMIGASSLALTVYLAAVALANAFSSFQRALSACSSRTKKRFAWEWRSCGGDAFLCRL